LTMRLVVYVHGSKRVGKTTFSHAMVEFAAKRGLVASDASIIAVVRNYIKDTFGLEDDHVHGDLKETPLPQFGGASARNLLDELVGWHFGHDPSRLCFVRGCMADIARRSGVQAFCIQDVIHAHEPPHIREAAERMGATAVGVHVSRPGHVDTYGVNMSPEEFDFSVRNDGTLQEYLDKVAAVCGEILRV